MKKYSWIVALLLALTLGFVFASCDNGEGGDGKDPRKVAGAGPVVPPGPSGPQVGDVVIELADLIGSAAVGDTITAASPFSKQGSSTVIKRTTDGVEFSGRGADYNGVDVSLAGLDFAEYEYEVTFAGYTTDKGSQTAVGGAAVKIGQAASPYTDLFALVTETLGTTVDGGWKNVTPVFGPPPGQMSMRISANEEPYDSGGHMENFTVTKFIIRIKTVL